VGDWLERKGLKGDGLARERLDKEYSNGISFVLAQLKKPLDLTAQPSVASLN
jgi:hypothetical protein